MATPIRLTEGIKTEIINEISKQLDTEILRDGHIKIEKSYSYKDLHATLIFTQKAYIKMTMLVQDYSSEIAWHGTVERIDTTTWKVTDIVVYPQIVTGATVNTDEDEYRDWLDSLEDDQINTLRYQGHSHVNMGVSPSGTDLEHQDKILESIKLQKDGYYIFQIVNKSWKTNMWIYDLAQNVKYDTSDITLIIEDTDVKGLLDTAEKLVRTQAAAASYGSTAGTAAGTGTALSSYSSGYSATAPGKGNSIKSKNENIRPLAKSKSKGKAKADKGTYYGYPYYDLDDDDDETILKPYDPRDTMYGHYGWGCY